MATLSDCIADRGIKSLFHFTPLQGLIAIYEVGQIRSRIAIEESSEWFDLNLKDVLTPPDALRLDGFRHLINTSITKPNTRLLRAFQSRAEDKDEPWCILELSCDLLLLNGVQFSVCNAASAAASRYGIGGGVVSFERLFMDTVVNGFGSLTRQGKALDEPTDEQAEALIPSPIPVGAVTRLHFDSVEARGRSLQALSLMGVEVAESKASVTPEWFL